MLSERSQTRRPHATRVSLHKTRTEIINVLDEKPQQNCDSCVLRMQPASDTSAPATYTLTAPSSPPSSIAAKSLLSAQRSLVASLLSY